MNTETQVNSDYQADEAAADLMLKKSDADRYQYPLCVDLDGTLILTDILLESLLELLKKNLFYLFMVPVWLCKGRANLKYQIAIRVDLDISTVPYNEPFLKYLRSMHRLNRKLVLCTASNEFYAKKIADHLQIFDDVFASNEHVNLAGNVKRDKLIEIYGKNRFDYAANARVDLAIWRHSHHAILVNSGKNLKKTVEKTTVVEKIFHTNQSVFKSLIKAVRAYQWSKNLLVFLPLLASQQYGNIYSIEYSIIAFFSFSLCASSVYLINDFFDLPADRHHPNKRNRPFASGAIPLFYGIALIPLLLAITGILTSVLPLEFTGFLFCYFVVSTLYSLILKRIPILDVLVLAGLYTLRILAGAAAISVTTSFWLLSFSMFFFLSIALAKRYTELLDQEMAAQTEKSGRQYRQEDLNTLISQGSSSGHVAVLVLALYINSEEVLRHYNTPELLWFICPLLLYWISKLWLNTQRQEVTDDPLVWAFSNRVSRGIAALCVLILLFAI